MEAVCTIDWLAFTVPAHDVIRVSEHLVSRFGGGVQLATARYGYVMAWSVFGSGRVMCNPARRDMGVHVELPSSALGELREDLFEFIRFVRSVGGKFSRVDVALDTDAVTPQQAIEMKRSGELVSPVRDWRYQVNQDDATTLYLGGGRGEGNASRRFVRIYDKGMETDPKLYEVGQWTRIEVQLRQEYAAEAARVIDEGEPLEGLILGALDFKELDSLNVTRRTRMAWWAEVLGGASKIRLNKSGVEQTLERTRAWIARQCAPALAKMRLAYGDDKWLLPLINEASVRLHEWQVAQARAWGDVWRGSSVMQAELA